MALLLIGEHQYLAMIPSNPSFYHQTVRLTLGGLLAFLLVQGPWMVLQGVAWAGMLRDTERGATLMERAGSTFSGTQPCDLCLVVQNRQHGNPAEEETPKPPAPPDELRLIYTLLPSSTLDVPKPRAGWFHTGWQPPASAPADPPSLPPPIHG